MNILFSTIMSFASKSTRDLSPCNPIDCPSATTTTSSTSGDSDYDGNLMQYDDDANAARILDLVLEDLIFEVGIDVSTNL